MGEKINQSEGGIRELAAFTQGETHHSPGSPPPFFHRPTIQARDLGSAGETSVTAEENSEAMWQRFHRAGKCSVIRVRTGVLGENKGEAGRGGRGQGD